MDEVKIIAGFYAVLLLLAMIAIATIICFATILYKVNKMENGREHGNTSDQLSNPIHSL